MTLTAGLLMMTRQDKMLTIIANKQPLTFVLKLFLCWLSLQNKLLIFENQTCFDENIIR